MSRRTKIEFWDCVAEYVLPTVIAIATCGGISLFAWTSASSIGRAVLRDGEKISIGVDSTLIKLNEPVQLKICISTPGRSRLAQGIKATVHSPHNATFGYFKDCEANITSEHCKKSLSNGATFSRQQLTFIAPNTCVYSHFLLKVDNQVIKACSGEECDEIVLTSTITVDSAGSISGEVAEETQ